MSPRELWSADLFGGDGPKGGSSQGWGQMLSNPMSVQAGTLREEER